MLNEKSEDEKKPTNWTPEQIAAFNAAEDERDKDRDELGRIFIENGWTVGGESASDSTDDSDENSDEGEDADSDKA